MSAGKELAAKRYAMHHNLTCEHCGAGFVSRDRTAKYCSVRCRVAAMRARRKAEAETNEEERI